MNRIKQILEEINSICVNRWNVKFFARLAFPVRLRYFAFAMVGHMHVKLVTNSYSCACESHFGLRFYVWKFMRLSKRVASYLFILHICFVLHSRLEMWLWWMMKCFYDGVIFSLALNKHVHHTFTYLSNANKSPPFSKQLKSTVVRLVQLKLQIY